MRAGFYIDGFNVYHAIDDLKCSWLKWSCYRQVAEKIVLPGHDVAHVKLFSAYATWRPDSHRRHIQYVAAARASGVEVVMGAFKEKRCKCRACGAQWVGHEEKETDVNLGIHLLRDSLTKAIDVAYVVTTDSDLAPAIKMVVESTDVNVITVSTPMRSHSKEILAHCVASRKINSALLEKCLMPEKIVDSLGVVLATRPPSYKPPLVL